MSFWKMLGAYLTGWLIVQPTYTALRRWWIKRDIANPSEITKAHYRMQAYAVVDALSSYRQGGDPPAALEVIVKQHTKIEELQRGLAIQRETASRLTHELADTRAKLAQAQRIMG